MTSLRSIFLSVILLGLFVHEGSGQLTSISNTINTYASVSRILCSDNGNHDSIEVVDATGFAAGDTALLYCVQGAEIDMSGDGKEADVGRDGRNPRNAGKYSIFIINEIYNGNILVLNVILSPEIKELGPGEVAQVIRMPSYHAARVTPAGLTAPDWDGSTGGVVAFLVRTTLELEGDIDVSGSGFQGAEPMAVYDGSCTESNPGLFDTAFFEIGDVKAGLKGEGTTDTLFQYMRGRGMNINGGGGGNGRLAGGGGGSNFSDGGKGGDESNVCDPGIDLTGGYGGFDLGRTYYDTVVSAFNTHNRIFLGGGGGTGTEIASRNTSNGGDGGGIVVIIADSIKGNGWIRADGADVTDIVNGAGGGGGGGGAIVLDVSGYGDNVRLSAKGGEGGSTNHANATGPGGGGGGGIYWLAGPRFGGLPGVNPQFSQGSSGEHKPSGSTYGARDGNFPGRLNSLETPLRGFIFNSVPMEFWVCSNEVPQDIRANRPKGGTGTYTYQWLDSSSTQAFWDPIPGATSRSLSFSSSLSDTAYFRRVVTDVPSGLSPDTSLRIAMYVHQAIENNVISADDEVCENNAPDPFVSVGSPQKGDGSYAYRWVRHEGDGMWATAPGDGEDPGYASPALDNPTGDTRIVSFARIVTSGACVDTTSGILEVEVFKSLQGNDVSPDSGVICYDTAPGELTGGALSGGDALDAIPYRYRWESSPNGTDTWTSVGVSTANYQSGNLTETIWFRRVAMSGDGDACTDNSDAVKIRNVPVVEDNSITGAEQSVCEALQPALEVGSSPTGGDGPGTYTYLWESSLSGTGPWTAADAANGNTNKDYRAPPMSDTTWIRRIVSSGGSEGVCTNTSTAKIINVLPSIVNNNILTEVTTLCQFDLLGELKQDGSAPAGGAMWNGTDDTRHFKWEQRIGEDGDWTQVSYGSASIEYGATPELDSPEDYWYRRIIFSGPTVSGHLQVCADTVEAEDYIHVTIHKAISNNEIDPSDSVCYAAGKVLEGFLPDGDDEIEEITYAWKELGGGLTLGTDKDLSHAFTTPEKQQLVREVVIGECESTSDTLDLTVMELPTGLLSGNLPKACAKDIKLYVDLNIDNISRYNLPWEVQLKDGVNQEWLPIQELTQDDSVDVSLYTDQVSMQFSYELARVAYFTSDGTECIATDLQGTVPIEVFFTPDPTITIEDEAFVIVDSAICNDEILLSVDPQHGTGNWDSNWPDKLGFDPGADALLVKAGIDPGDSLAWMNIPYRIWFTSHAGDCWGSDTVTINFYEQPAPANAGLDDTIYLSNSTYLQADPATAGEGTWTVVEGQGSFEDEHAPHTFVFDLAKDKRNEFRWTVVNGVCITSDDNSVITQAEVMKYEGISPNGDGYNDFFIVRGLDNPRARFTLMIFNSLGRRVRTVTEENVDEITYDPGQMMGGIEEGIEKVVWDGKSDNGTLVPAATYYYSLEVEIDQVDDQGNILGVDRKQYKHYIVVRD